MSTNIEIEVKTLITEANYRQVLEFYKNETMTPIEQINYYIDTKDAALKKHEISLRIRRLNGFVMTLKTPLSEGLLEKSQLISEKEFKNFIENNTFPNGTISEFIERLYIEPSTLTPLAELKTTRINVPYDGYILSIDRNEYANEVDYELEMEGPSVEKARAFLEEVCKKVDVIFTENKVSKQKRALLAYRKLKE
ncbi:MAG TPA: CYTH domain-containing protein [Bacilli bacterium]|nr:CYTH domain-containing protein [Bacilli bacterium]